MRGGLRSWKRGIESRGIRNALSYAFDGTCDAAHTIGATAAVDYGAGADATVTRFTVVDGLIATDALDTSALRRWIEGRNPATDEPRGRVLRSENADLLLDGTINFPKSYSIAAVLDPELATEFEALQDRLRDRVLLLWQRELNARRGAGGCLREDIARLEVVELQHRRSRALDPHIHRHLWLNMKVQGADGKWSSLDSRVALKLQTVVNAEGELAARTDPAWIAALAAHGYSLDAEGEISQLAKAVRPLSRRSNQIEANRVRLTATWRSEHAGREPGPEELHHIDELSWAQGRPNKPQEVDEHAWVDRVRREVASVDAALLESRHPTALPHRVIADLDRELLARMALVEADARSVSSSGRFSEWDVRAAAMRAIAAQDVVTGRDTLDELIEDITSRALRETVDLAPDDPAKPPHIKAFMAEATVLLKLRVGNRFAALSQPGFLPEPQQVFTLSKRHAGEHGGLDLSQLAAAAAIAGTGRLVSVTGPAGSGKTTLLRVAHDALALQRRSLVVVAPTRKAAVVAEREIGAPAASLHALLADHGWRWRNDEAGAVQWKQLERGETDVQTGQRYDGPRQHRLRPGDRIVVDEAGMVDLHTAHALAIVAEQTAAGIAMIGDPLQAAPVGHSGAMAALTRHADHVVELRAVHRFADPAYADLTLRLRNVHSATDAAQVAEDLASAGHLRRVSSDDAAHEAMVEAWFHWNEQNKRVALVTASNDAADAVSEAIQQRRLERGELTQDAVAIGRDGQRLLVGDVVQTRLNDRASGVQNRAHWIITGIEAERVQLANVRDDTERRFVSVDYAAEHLHLAYASTVHGAQGETTDAALVGPGVDAAGLYVGLTRGRDWNQAIVVARSDSTAREDLADTMRRGLPELTLEDARRSARIDLNHAARDRRAPTTSSVQIAPLGGVSSGMGL